MLFRSDIVQGGGNVRFVPITDVQSIGERRRLRLAYASAILEAGFVLHAERHRARDKTFLGGGIVQTACDVLIRVGRELDVRPQRDAFELPGAVRLLDLHTGGLVAVCHDRITLRSAARGYLLVSPMSALPPKAERVVGDDTAAPYPSVGKRTGPSITLSAIFKCTAVNVPLYRRIASTMRARHPISNA